MSNSASWLADVTFDSESKEGQMTRQTYLVSNISCAHCTERIESALKSVAGVQAVSADRQTKQVTVTVADPQTLGLVESTLYDIGYPGVK